MLNTSGMRASADDCERYSRRIRRQLWVWLASM